VSEGIVAVVQAPNPSEAPSDEAIIKLFTTGDLIDLDPKQKAQYLAALCGKLGLNPLSKPFDILYVKDQSGKQKAILYANRTASDQLRKIHNIRTEVVYDGPLKIGELVREDVYRVDIDITFGERTERHVGCVSIGGLQGEALANAIMKCHTKALRRATLSIVGLGLPDESEVDTIPGVITQPAPRVLQPPVDTDYTVPSMPRVDVSTQTNPNIQFPRPLPAAKPPVK